MTFWLCNTLIYVLIFWFQRLVSVEQCDLISSSSTWGCVLCCLLFQVDFSQGFVDFFVLVPVSIPAYWVVKWWLFFCRSSGWHSASFYRVSRKSVVFQLADCSLQQRKLKNTENAPCLMPPPSKCQCAKGCSWMVLSE